MCAFIIAPSRTRTPSRSSETANAGDAAKSAAITKTSRRMILSNSESKSQSRSTSQSQSLSQKSQSRSRRQSQNQSYSESRSGIVDGKMRAAEQRMIWKSGQKMTQIVLVTADDGKVGDAHRAAEDCGKAGDALRGLSGLSGLREDLRELNAGRNRPVKNDDEEADIQRRQLDLTNLTHFYMRDLGDSAQRKHAPPPVTVQGPEVTANVGGAVLRCAAQAAEELPGAVIPEPQEKQRSSVVMA